MVMGDIVLLEDEVSPAMSAALDNGLEVTALHNHFFFESPRVMYMHIGGAGDPAKLATAVKKVIDAQRAVRSASPEPARAFAGKIVPTENKITAGPIDQILGTKGEMNNGMYKVDDWAHGDPPWSEDRQTNGRQHLGSVCGYG